MNDQIQLTRTIPVVRTSLNRSPLRRGFFLIALGPLALASFALSPPARAACQDDCLTNGNTRQGESALISLTTGANNTAIGAAALNSNTTGRNNTANGFQALNSNTTGSNNLANGYQALFSNTTGSTNLADGAFALISNTTGNFNTANGFNALYSNTTGTFNTADGSRALSSNTTGSFNTATGFEALLFNTTGANNLASGYQALYSNTTGNNNMATGANAMHGNTTGFFNMANGSFAMVHNTTGHYNVAEGLNALFNNTTGSNNIAIGLAAGGNLTTGSGNIDIGNRGVAAEVNTIRIGFAQTKTFVAGVRNAVTAGGVAVFVNASGQLGTNPSSKRFKQEIAPMDKKSEAILSLRPVAFHYKQEFDPNKTAQFGLIAEEVAQVNPDLVARDDKGEIYSVRYEAVNAMLLNEFLKEHRKVEEQEATIHQLVSTMVEQRKGMEVLTASLKEQASKIQKVSNQIEVNRTAPQMVANNQ